MQPSKRRGSRVIYVAGSARELPGEVQDWLGQGGHRASSSPHIYDALAMLAAGRKPVAIIVSIDAVDWNELDFFDHAIRLSEQTRIYVTGHDHQHAKIEAACARGARPFDADALDNDLEAADARKETLGPAGLLAGSLRPAQPLREPGSETWPEADRTEPELEEGQRPEPPAVRLIISEESDEEEGDADTPRSIPVPWAPSPDRPQRTPPRPPTGQEQAPESLPTTSPPRKPAAPQRPAPAPIELTPEELAALLGKPARRDAGSLKERRQ